MNLEEQWPQILEDIRVEYEIQDVTFNSFLKPLKIKKIEDNNLYLVYSADSNEVALTFLRKRYETPIKVKIAEMTGVEYNVHFVLPEKDISGMIKKNDVPAIKMDASYEKTNLNPIYTFDTFVVGNNNRFAQTACLAVADTPGEAYNPLYIYGGPGLGKTHLMHSIGNYIIQKNPNKKVLYVTSEEFMNMVIESIRDNRNDPTVMTKFRDKYRNVDVLMIDDIQTIIGRESTQEEFFHTFNSLHQAGKQIVITSDRPPKDMKTLELRIRSRFEMGLMADIGYPDYETRMAILRKKSEEKNVNLNDDILNYIADNIKSNIREIEGALNKLIAFKMMEKVEITLDIAERELQSIISPDKPREITPQLIIEVVADHYGITVDQMISSSRQKMISRPRQIAMYLCREMVDTPLNAIGSLLGDRNHATIIHGANTIAQEYNESQDFRNEVDAIKKKISPV